MPISRRALYSISANDPDGWTTREPTDADRAEFKAWALRCWGQDAWDTYCHVLWRDSN